MTTTNATTEPTYIVQLTNDVPMEFDSGARQWRLAGETVRCTREMTRTLVKGGYGVVIARGDVPVKH